MRRLQLFTSLGDLILPSLLYFWWQWDLHFILLFVYLDVLAAVIFAFIKERKIQTTQQLNTKRNPIFKNFWAYVFFTLIGIYVFEWAIHKLYADMNLWQSFIDFLWFKELGVPQIVWLAPLLFLVNYQQYNAFFVRINLDKITPLVYQQKTHFYTFALFLANALVFFALTWFFTEPKLIFLIVLIGNKLLGDLLILPKLQQKIVKKMVLSPHD
jgi:hypothetical protein